MRIYISGPISHPEYWVQQANLEKFREAEAQLRAAGYHDIFNPANAALDENPSYADYMKHDIRNLLDCEAMALLPGSGQSQGAMVEYRVAGVLGLKILTLHEWLEQARP